MKLGKELHAAHKFPVAQACVLDAVACRRWGEWTTALGLQGRVIQGVK